MPASTTIITEQNQIVSTYIKGNYILIKTTEKITFSHRSSETYDQ